MRDKTQQLWHFTHRTVFVYIANTKECTTHKYGVLFTWNWTLCEMRLDWRLFRCDACICTVCMWIGYTIRIHIAILIDRQVYQQQILAKTRETFHLVKLATQQNANAQKKKKKIKKILKHIHNFIKSLIYHSFHSQQQQQYALFGFFSFLSFLKHLNASIYLCFCTKWRIENKISNKVKTHSYKQIK